MCCYGASSPGPRADCWVLPQRTVVAYDPRKQITPYLFR
nr:MAG TPA: hypothetical protein [Caudoviricetes sp.]